MTRYKVVVVDVEGLTQPFDDASFSVNGDGFLQVSVNSRAIYCWAAGYWTRVSMVAQDG